MKLCVARDSFIAYKLRVNHLVRRLPEHALITAVAPGLQDSGPLGALLSLHARVNSVKPDSWERPELVQVWGPRGAVYVVSRKDFAVFTFGRLPRDTESKGLLERKAAICRSILSGSWRSCG